MIHYEYKVVPAPSRGVRRKGLKGAEAGFAAALAEVMNSLGAEEWEYLRAETLPCEERQGLLSRTTVMRHVLVFRRPRAAAADTARPGAAAAPAPAVEAAAPPGRVAPLGPARSAEAEPGPVIRFSRESRQGD